MNGIPSAAPNPKALLRATEAITNWRALTAALLGGVAIFLCLALTGWLAGTSLFLGFLGMLATVGVALVAYSTVGIILMRSAQGQHIEIAAAVQQAVATVHRLLGVGVMMLLMFLGVLLAALIIMYLCRIPGVGPLLFAVAYPVLAVVLGLTVVAYYVAAALSGPAIWEGNPVFGTIARVLAIVRRRLPTVIVSLLLLMLLVFVIAFVIGFVLMTGNGLAIGMANSAHVPLFDGFGDLLRGWTFREQALGGSFEGSGSYSKAFGFGAGLLFTLGAVVPALTVINGSCLIYLQAIDGLDLGDTEQRLRNKLDDATRRPEGDGQDGAQTPL